jgi:hypothetical protein
MTLYSLVLFVHIAAVLALFAALSLEAVSQFHLRRASKLADAQLWIEPVPGLPIIAMGSLLVALFSGVYLIVRVSAFGAAWPKVTIAALLLVAPLAAISARRVRAIRRTCLSMTAFSPDLRRRLQDPLLTVSLGVRIAVNLGIVLLMTAKPAFWESVGIVGASVALGLLSPVLVTRRERLFLSE